MATILLVDDDEDLNEALSIFLEMKGYRIKSASSQDIVTQILSFSFPDLILLDVLIKDCDGRKLCKEIKDCSNNSIKVILMSASSKLLENFEHWGADAVLEKPFDFNLFCRKISEVLDKP